MRHVQLKPIQISSWLMVLQQREQITTGIWSKVPQMHKSAFPMCKAFPGLQPKAHHWCDSRTFELSLLVQRNKNLISQSCMQDVWTWHNMTWRPAGPELCTLCGHGHCSVAGWHQPVPWYAVRQCGFFDVMLFLLGRITICFDIIKLWFHLHQLLTQPITLFHTRVCQCVDEDKCVALQATRQWVSVYMPHILL
jgi:hypothetical protein